MATSKHTPAQDLPAGMMPFFRFGDVRNAEWLVRQPAAGSDAIGWYVPAGFPAYVLIRYPARQRPNAHEVSSREWVLITQAAYMRAIAQGRTDVAPPIEHHFLMEQPKLAAAVLDILSPQAERSENRMLQCAFWEGSSCHGCAAPLFRTPQEGFHLFEAPERSLLRWLVDQGDRQSPRWNPDLAGQEPPCMIWPAGRGWCLVLTYSYSFGVVACSQALAEEILRIPGLDASPVELDDSLSKR